MNVFEDFVEELKEDQLLEETFIGSNEPSPNGKGKAEPKQGRSLSSGEHVDAAAQNGHSSAGDKRAFNSEEVAALQVVEVVFKGIEREILKTQPEPYDDLAVKQALHHFVHSKAAPESDETFELESSLYTEIERWKQKLLARDAKMTLANFRVYCETSQPPLSSQALFALSRFYFGTGTSVEADVKLEFILTRLFSKRDEGERRLPLFTKDETIAHLRKRFLDWRCDPSTDADIDHPDAMLSVMSFEEFSNEVANAVSFETLVKSDFFNRLAMFKESIRAQFTSPTIVAVCIRCNIAVGNSVIGLLEKSGQKMSPVRFRKKFSSLSDELLGRAVGRTIDLEEVLSNSTAIPEPAAPKQKPVTVNETSHPSKSPQKKQGASFLKGSLFAVNKWLLLFSILLISASVGLYFWTEYNDTEKSAAPTVPTVELAGFEFKDDVKTAKISGDTMYAVMTTTWDTYTDDKKQEVVKGLYAFATKKGAKKLNVMNRHGASVAFATGNRTEISGQ